MLTTYLLIKGKVQGVYYRATAKEVAQQLALTGWVKNTKEGNVEATVSGPPAAIEQFITWCKKGPKQAIVTTVETKVLEEQTFEAFTIIRD
jgi:acylphosphatase